MYTGRVVHASLTQNLAPETWLVVVVMLVVILLVFVLPVYLAFRLHRRLCDRSNCRHKRAHGQIGVLSVPDSGQ